MAGTLDDSKIIQVVGTDGNGNTRSTYPVTRLVAVTPGPTELDLVNGQFPRGIYVGVAGNVTVLAADDTVEITVTNLAAGIWHPMSVRKVTAATALNILVAY